MVQRSKTSSRAQRSSAELPEGANGARSCDGGADSPQGLSAEVVSLLNEQAFAQGEACTEGQVCESFSQILLRHWDLCCLATFLRGEGGGLNACASFTHGHLDAEAARALGEAAAAEVLRTGEEFSLGLGADAAEGGGGSAASELLKRAGLGACAAVPVSASGALAGVVVAASEDAARLRDAVGGVRCVSQAVVIALGNARRSAAMSEQRRRIESLVAELRSRTAELESANLELQRVGRYRSLFLARMSHELRTPLTSILGFAEILLDQEDLSETQRRFCGKIQSSGFQLQASLNQLVDLSRLEAGHTELFLHEFSLRETLRESCAAVSRLAQKQGVTLECVTAPEVGGVLSDEGKLRQVLYNFLAFAIGRSPAGGAVNVHAVSVEGGGPRIEITDSGEPLQDRARLFEPVDIDAPNERGTNMNELGLVIAHRLLDVLGGSVTLHDLEPAGLSVHLNLPARPTGK
ncbi:MAG TPA: HAMP domain-containing sensor histidine kinase [Pyrinomonadaceae bacterium]